MTAPEIRYIAYALTDADDALSYVTHEVRWSETMRARKTASYGLPYNYSGQTYPACEMPQRRESEICERAIPTL